MFIVLKDTVKVSQFSSIMKNLKNFSSDIEIIVDENRLYAQGMDSSHCCLYELVLFKDWFCEYKVDKSYVLGLNCEMLAKVLNCLSNDQFIEMMYNEKKDNLQMTLKPLEGESGIIKVFQIPLMDTESELLEIPDSEFSADVEMISAQFGELVNQLSIFGNDFEIKCGDNIVITGKGENGCMNAVISEDDIISYAIEEDTELTLTYSGLYINLITAFSKINKKVQIHFSEDIPMKIQYGMDNFMDNNVSDDETDVIEDKNFIRFFLAPKISD
tara:strand:+ start:1546 stop:2361 length:816 start_codon:yes stop_codon:yes gene_type:complete